MKNAIPRMAPSVALMHRHPTGFPIAGKPALVARGWRLCQSNRVPCYHGITSASSGTRLPPAILNLAEAKRTKQNSADYHTGV